MSRYILIGGFLGAGKSTAIQRLTRFLEERGESVGLGGENETTFTRWRRLPGTESVERFRCQATRKMGLLQVWLA